MAGRGRRFAEANLSTVHHGPPATTRLCSRAVPRPPGGTCGGGGGAKARRACATQRRPNPLSMPPKAAVPLMIRDSSSSEDELEVSLEDDCRIRHEFQNFHQATRVAKDRKRPPPDLKPFAEAAWSEESTRSVDAIYAVPSKTDSRTRLPRWADPARLQMLCSAMSLLK